MIVLAGPARAPAHQPRTHRRTGAHDVTDTPPAGGPPRAAVIGYTEGAFDLFHIGHLDLLAAAAQRCDHLVVGVLSDELCEATTGARPYTPAAERRSVVEAVRGVAAVVPVAVEDLAAMRARTGFTVVFRHGGPGVGHPGDVEPAGEFAAVDLPQPRRTTSAVLAAALSAHLVPAAEL